MSTLTTGLAGQQQLRSARPGGPAQTFWSSAAPWADSASRCLNLIFIHHSYPRRIVPFPVLSRQSHRARPAKASPYMG